MVKFKFLLITPYGSHTNTHYAKTAERAKETVELWDKQFGRSGYRVKLLEIKDASDAKVPSGYTVW